MCFHSDIRSEYGSILFENQVRLFVKVAVSCEDSLMANNINQDFNFYKKVFGFNNQPAVKRLTEVGSFHG